MTEPAPPFAKLSVLSGLWQGIWPKKPTFLPDQYPDLSGISAIVTGANTGIGYEVAKLLYGKNCDVIAVVRSELKGKEAREKILSEVNGSGGSIEVISGCDFLDLSTVKPAAEKIKAVLGDRPLGIIIHNAGLMAPNSNGTSKQGFEAMFSVNVLGPQLLQHFLDPLFLKKDAAIKRIVWVSSAAHLYGFKEYGINWDNPTFRDVPVNRRPHHQTLYGQSKAANVLQANAWAVKNQKAVDEISCVSVSCFPGVLYTQLVRDWGFLANKLMPLLTYGGVYGAYTELYSALSPDLTRKDQGAYTIPFGQIGEPRADIKAGMRNGSDLKLWDIAEDIISDYF
ncbi:hypothetical protein HG536_0B05900 [Torulaspora globosa]|uniref:Ketoreductase (KR) domain-containing protein n=1 Tax=Torulaspora globosa TaxID=48254 RepID=A0A7G3ZDY8_9SACH|nr:uncharacterized protein HG536_0B05900 [Torulaspora globosa]QLL31724.1 hypothetical protein HG536_0B05900 [Torulaspora globosa]